MSVTMNAQNQPELIDQTPDPIADADKACAVFVSVDAGATTSGVATVSIGATTFFTGVVVVVVVTFCSTGAVMVIETGALVIAP